MFELGSSRKKIIVRRNHSERKFIRSESLKKKSKLKLRPLKIYAQNAIEWAEPPEHPHHRNSMHRKDYVIRGASVQS